MRMRSKKKKLHSFKELKDYPGLVGIATTMEINNEISKWIFNWGSYRSRTQFTEENRTVQYETFEFNEAMDT